MEKNARVTRTSVGDESRGAGVSRSGSTYADGMPLDRVQHLEAQIDPQAGPFPIRGKFP